MKSTALIVVALIFIYEGLFAQDIIFKKDGNEIKSKVVEITELAVKYMNFDQLNGPIRNITKDQIFMITYQNGSVEKFSSLVAQGNTSIPVEVQTFTSVPFKDVKWTEKSRSYIYSSSGDLDQRYIKELNCSENSRFISLYYVNPAQQWYSYNLYDIITDKYIDISSKTKLDDYGSTLNSFSSFSPQSNQFYTFLNGNILQFFDVNSGNELNYHKGDRYFRKPRISYPGLSFNEQNRNIETNNSYIFSGNDFQVKKLSSENDFFELLRTGNGDFRLESGKDLMRLEFVPNKNLAIGWPLAFSKSISLYDLTTGRILLRFDDPGKGMLSAKCKISPDGTLLIGSLGNNIIVWDISSGRLIKTLAAHEKFINDFDITQNNLLATCSAVESINLWNINENFAKIATIDFLNKKGKNASPAYILFTKNGEKLCCITFQSELIVWDLTYY